MLLEIQNFRDEEVPGRREADFLPAFFSSPSFPACTVLGLRLSTSIFHCAQFLLIMAQDAAPKDPLSGMAHSEAHYFNSYNHHGIHEEMLVCISSCTASPEKKIKEKKSEIKDERLTTIPLLER